jgi:hypothetical protein
MTANTVNRETVRDAFAALLSTALVGTGLPVEVVYEYPYGKVNTSPTICIASGGTSHQRAGIGDKRWHNHFCLEIYTFIKKPDGASGWTEAMVEDRLDLIDKSIADCVADNRVNTNWDNISYSLDARDEGVPPLTQIVVDTQRGYKVEITKIYIHKMDV